MAVVQFEFLSNVLGEMINVSLILPTDAAAREAVKQGKKFKVIYLLHGGGGDCNSFIKDTSIALLAEQGGFAVVMPEVRYSYYCDMQYGLPYFTYLSEELPGVVETVFPISPKREDHFLMGNSMGAYGTIKWALRRPDFFAAAAGMSGVADLTDLGFTERFDSDDSQFAPFRAAFGSREDYYGSENDVKFLAKRLAESGQEMPRLFSCCGTEDFAYAACEKFAVYANEIGLPVVFEKGPGAHTNEFWEIWMRRIIKWFGLWR